MRPGRPILAVAACLLAMAVMAGCGSQAQDSGDEIEQHAESIMVYCGAGMREPMLEVAADFQEEYGTRVDFNFGGCGTHLAQLETTREGDVFMPGDSSYIDKAAEKGFIDASGTVAYHIPVIIVPTGNPAGIESLADLAKPGVKVVWGDPEACSIGKQGNRILENNGLKDAVWANVIATTATVDKLNVYVGQRQADASLSWTDERTEGVQMIEIPLEQNLVQLISIGALSFSGNADTAKAFVEFCASDAGKRIFESHGFEAYPDPRYEKRD